MEKGKSRNWCYTLNNYTEEEYENIWKAEALYHIQGREIAPTTGTPHIQGFIRLKDARDLGYLKRNVNGRARWTKAKGSDIQNQIYCSKTGEFREHGTPQKQGKRNDIKAIKEAIKEGKGMKDIIDIAPNYQTLKYAELALKHMEKGRDWETEVHWLYGPTGSGKTQLAANMLPDAWWSGKNLKWWEGYDGHEHVIIDDFRADFCTFHELLRILDRYPYRVETKGGSRQLRAKKIVITSCYHPSKIYNTREDINQLIRRCTTISEIVKANCSEVEGNTEPQLEQKKEDEDNIYQEFDI